jgi:putative membrane fusion protein
MATRKTKKRKKGAPKIYKYGMFLIFLFFAVGIYVYYNQSFSTQVVYSGKEESIVPTKGIVIFDEEILESKTKGFALLNYSDGTRVPARTHIATLFSGNIDEAKSTNIKELSEKINMLENSIKNRNSEEIKSESSNSILLKKMKNVSYFSQKGDFQSLNKESREIGTIVGGDENSSLDKQLNLLIEKRNDIERTITGEKSIFNSNTSGIIYSKTDGYETTLNLKNVENIDVALFNTLWNSKPTDYGKSNEGFIFGKIVNNYFFTIVTAISKKDAEGLVVGKEISIKSSDIKGGNIPCFITRISPESGGKVVLSLRATKSIDEFLKERKISFDLVKDTYEGLRLPKEAILTDNNGKSIYVIKDGMVKKKSIKVLFEKNEFAIIEEDNTNSKNVLLYDLVITKSKNITEGMIVPSHR